MSRPMLHRFAGLAATLACVGAVGLPIAVASAASARAAAAGPAKISLRRTGLGMILVNGHGRTLYAFTKDGRNRDRCGSMSGCTSVWPQLTSRGTPQAGRGVRRSLLSTIRLPGGSHQVTYAGHPLYTYVGDSSAGDTAYVGAVQFGGTWLAVGASGATVR